MGRMGIFGVALGAYFCDLLIIGSSRGDSWFEPRLK
jgi:hypothetical protein